jgi:hypothetical protein
VIARLLDVLDPWRDRRRLRREMRADLAALIADIERRRVP